MTIGHLTCARKTAGFIGAVFCFLIAVVLIDSLISRFAYEYNVIYTYPNDPYELTGVMPEKSETIKDLFVETESPDVSLNFTEVFSGFWFGTTMWRGTIMVSESAEPGNYGIKVRNIHETKVNPALVFRVKVYADEVTLRKSHGTFLSRHFNITAGWAASILFPGLVMTLLLNYGVSCRLEKALADIGQAEVYLIKRVPEGIQIGFALGKKQGLTPGERIDILNSDGQVVGEADVLVTGATDAIASPVASVNAAAIHSVRRHPT